MKEVIQREKRERSKPSEEFLFNHGRRIAQIREQLKMNQEQFAEILDMSKDMVGKIEQSKNQLSAHQAVKLCQRYGYSLEYIYGISKTQEVECPLFRYDFRDLFELRNGVNLSIKDGDMQAKERMFITINIKREQLIYLLKIFDAKKKYKNNHINQDELKVLTDKLKKDYKHRNGDITYTVDIPLDALEEKGESILTCFVDDFR